MGQFNKRGGGFGGGHHRGGGGFHRGGRGGGRGGGHRGGGRPHFGGHRGGGGFGGQHHHGGGRGGHSHNRTHHHAQHPQQHGQQQGRPAPSPNNNRPAAPRVFGQVSNPFASAPQQPKQPQQFQEQPMDSNAKDLLSQLLAHDPTAAIQRKGGAESKSAVVSTAAASASGRHASDGLMTGAAIDAALTSQSKLLHRQLMFRLGASAAAVKPAASLSVLANLVELAPNAQQTSSGSQSNVASTKLYVIDKYARNPQGQANGKKSNPQSQQPSAIAGSSQKHSDNPALLNDMHGKDDFRHPSREFFPAATMPKLLQWHRVMPIGSGFRNLGNTCFLNSALQCLLYTPPLANILRMRYHSKVRPCPTTAKGSFCLFCELERLSARAFQPGASGVAPNSIVNNLRVINKAFRPGRQEDAHEALRYMLDFLQNNCLAQFDKTKDERVKETTVMHRMFGGYFRSQVKCSVCKHESNTYDPFMDVSLEIHRTSSLLKALSHFTAAEILDNDNKYMCSKCKKKVQAKKQLTIFRTPVVLTIHLKRFQFAHMFGGKIGKDVPFDAELDLTPFVSKQSNKTDAKYQLFGVLVHSGSSLQSGHYYAFVRSSSGTWHEMNDSFVRQVSLKTVLSQQAYILMYVKKEVHLPSFQTVVSPQRPMSAAKGEATTADNNDEKQKPNKQKEGAKSAASALLVGIDNGGGLRAERDTDDDEPDSADAAADSDDDQTMSASDDDDRKEHKQRQREQASGDGVSMPADHSDGSDAEDDHADDSDDWQPGDDDDELTDDVSDVEDDLADRHFVGAKRKRHSSLFRMTFRQLLGVGNPLRRGGSARQKADEMLDDAEAELLRAEQSIRRASQPLQVVTTDRTGRTESVSVSSTRGSAADESWARANGNISRKAQPNGTSSESTRASSDAVDKAKRHKPDVPNGAAKDSDADDAEASEDEPEREEEEDRRDRVERPRQRSQPPEPSLKRQKLENGAVLAVQPPKEQKSIKSAAQKLNGAQSGRPILASSSFEPSSANLLHRDVTEATGAWEDDETDEATRVIQKARRAELAKQADETGKMQRKLKDEWDTALDTGRLKKVKQKKPEPQWDRNVFQEAAARKHKQEQASRMRELAGASAPVAGKQTRKEERREENAAIRATKRERAAYAGLESDEDTRMVDENDSRREKAKPASRSSMMDDEAGEAADGVSGIDSDSDGGEKVIGFGWNEKPRR